MHDSQGKQETFSCVRLMNHRPVLLKQIIHYMLIKKLKTQKHSDSNKC